MVTDQGKTNDELKSITWKDLAEFKDEASNGSDPDVKKFADDTAKVTQEHLDQAKEINGKLTQ